MKREREREREKGVEVCFRIEMICGEVLKQIETHTCWRRGRRWLKGDRGFFFVQMAGRQAAGNPGTPVWKR